MLPNSIADAHRLLRSGEISAVQLVDEFSERIDRLNPRFNAFISLGLEQARASARAADERGYDPETPALAGIPINLKDLMDWSGHPTTCGTPRFTHVADTNATAVDNLLDDGAIIVGKTNLHEFAWGGTNENVHYGTTYNPWNPKHICHGSSGGSAASVAAGLSFASIGSDTGTSIRQPSAVTGLTGLRPTLGTIPMQGVFPLAPTMDTIGPMALDARDCAIVYRALSGVNPPAGKNRPGNTNPVETATPPGADMTGFTVGMIRDFSDTGATPHVLEGFARAVEQMQDLGAKVVEIDIPNMHDFYLPWILIHSIEPAITHQHLLKSHPDMYSPDVEVMLRGASEISAVDYNLALQWRQHFIAAVTQAVTAAGLDAVIFPTTPDVASVAGIPIETYTRLRLELPRKSTTFAGVASLLGFPSVSAPMGLHDGLPMGIQFMGLPHTDLELLRLVEAFQQGTNWHHATRELWDTL